MNSISLESQDSVLASKNKPEKQRNYKGRGTGGPDGEPDETSVVEGYILVASVGAITEKR